MNLSLAEKIGISVAGCWPAILVLLCMLAKSMRNVGKDSWWQFGKDDPVRVFLFILFFDTAGNVRSSLKLVTGLLAFGVLLYVWVIA